MMDTSIPKYFDTGLWKPVAAPEQWKKAKAPETLDAFQMGGLQDVDAFSTRPLVLKPSKATTYNTKSSAIIYPTNMKQDASHKNQVLKPKSLLFVSITYSAITYFSWLV